MGKLEHRVTSIEQATAPASHEVVLAFAHRSSDGTVTLLGQTAEELMAERCRERSCTDPSALNWVIGRITFVEPGAPEASG